LPLGGSKESNGKDWGCGVTTGTDRSEHERLVAALKASRAGTWRWDIPGDRVEWDEALSAVYGLPHVQAPKTSGEFFQLIHPDDRERAGGLIGALLEQGSEIEYEFRAVVGDRIVWINDRSTLARDADGRPFYMTGACLDVTARKQIEEERNVANERYRLLLRELNHRVTNHLQMITAMLRLQAAQQADPAAREEFEKAIQRIRTLAELHGHLYRDENVDSVDGIDMRAYLDGICGNLRSAVLPPRVSLSCEVAPVRLTIDQAVPLGLIVSELATNAAKYAFPGDRPGQLAVRLEIDGDRAALSVSDDGVGLPNVPETAGTGIGLGMVKGLAQQIRGVLAAESGAGTVFTLRFTPDRPIS
jgi:PAS domain S-box-containing protein